MAVDVDKLVQVLRREAIAAANPGDRVRLAERLHAELDQAIEQLNQPAPACRPGCHACCSRMVTVSFSELTAIFNITDSWDDGRREQLKLRAQEQFELTRSFWNYEDTRYLGTCPLLENGLCSVYDQRPAECRGESSFEASACQRHANGEQVTVPRVQGQADLARTCLIASLREGDVPYDLADALYRYYFANQDSLEESLKPSRLATHPQQRAASETLGRVLSSPTFKLYEEKAKGDTERAWMTLGAFKSRPFGLLGRMVLPTLYRSQDELEMWWQRTEEALLDWENSAFEPLEAFESMALFHTFQIAYSGKNVKDFMTRRMMRAHWYDLSAQIWVDTTAASGRLAGLPTLETISRRSHSTYTLAKTALPAIGSGFVTTTISCPSLPAISQNTFGNWTSTR
jgi:Fe-S-cluster containining protein